MFSVLPFDGTESAVTCRVSGGYVLTYKIADSVSVLAFLPWFEHKIVVFVSIRDLHYRFERRFLNFESV